MDGLATVYLGPPLINSVILVRCPTRAIHTSNWVACEQVLPNDPPCKRARGVGGIAVYLPSPFPQ
jgi:hypothetical protein